jgi:hypothetical protein
MDRASKYVLGGAGQEIIALVHDPIFIGSVAFALTAYIGLWFAPEPVFTKITAALTTIALLSTGLFSISVIKKLAQAWFDIDNDADTASTDEEIEVAAKRFGSRIGAAEADCLVFLASLLGARALPMPKGAPGATEALSAAERALAAPQPDGVVIRGPWGRAGVKPSGGSPPRAMFDESGNPLKVEFFQAPAPEPLPQPVAPPVAAKAPAAAPAPRAPQRPAIAAAPGVATQGKEQTPESNSMRHQIQRGDNHFSSQAVSADAKVGVTALQLRNTMDRNFTTFMSIARNEQPAPPGWTRGPVSWEPAIRTAIIMQSQAITPIVAAGGIRLAGDVNALRKCFDPRTLAPSNCATDDVRLDIENKGHNLRS